MFNTLRWGCIFLSRSSRSSKLPFTHCRPSSSGIFDAATQWPLAVPLAHRIHSSRRIRSSAEATAHELGDVNDHHQNVTHNVPRHSISSAFPKPENGPVTMFRELVEREMVDGTIVETLIKDMGLETMTPVQSLTINETLKGVDVLAQARTGTGKTLAFLIPVLQNIISHDPSLAKRVRGGNGFSPTDIRAIIVSPTRELAEQIAVEAQKVVRNTGIVVQTAVGGSAKQVGLRKIRSEGCHVLIGTPGRLNDILSDVRSGVRAPNLSAFVLDEADRLLDQGFAPDIERIQSFLPDRQQIDRQTLLFSATVPEEVMDVVRSVMKPNFKFVRTIQKGEQQTHERVPQKEVLLAGLENQMPALVELCKRELAQTDAEMPFKAIVYFNATAETTLGANIFNNLRHPDNSRFGKSLFHPAKIIEMHGKLTQYERDRNSGDFRRAKSGILLSSDVTARGMDFPDVTHVIQMGVPVTRDTYIHRIGRTARGNKKGEGWIFLTPAETHSRDSRLRLQGLPLQADTTLQSASVDMTQDGQLPAAVAETLTQVVQASRLAPMAVKEAAYRATLGIFQHLPNKQEVVNMMNNRSRYQWAMQTPPGIPPGLALRLGLHRLQGIQLTKPNLDDVSHSNSGGGRGGRPSGFDREPSYSGYRKDGATSSKYDRANETSSPYGRDRTSSRFGHNTYGSRGGRSYQNRERGGVSGFEHSERRSAGRYNQTGSERGGFGGTERRSFGRLSSHEE